MKKKAIRRQLNTILAKLETMQAEIEDVLGEVLVPFPTEPDTEPRPDMDDDDIDYSQLHTYIIQEDGTRRECEE